MAFSTVGSPSVSECVLKLCPRYHFCASLNRYCAMPPYHNSHSRHATHATRMFALGEVDNAAKVKVCLPVCRLYCVRPVALATALPVLCERFTLSWSNSLLLSPSISLSVYSSIYLPFSVFRPLTLRVCTHAASPRWSR